MAFHGGLNRQKPRRFGLSSLWEKRPIREPDLEPGDCLPGCGYCGVKPL